MKTLGCALAALLMIGLLCSPSLAQTLLNGQFTTPYIYYDDNTTVANNWQYFREYMNPKFQQSTFEQMPGGPGGEISCQQIWADWSSYIAGIYQRVSGCTPGTAYTLTGWCMSIYQHGLTPPAGQYIGQKLGIDPYGGTDPLSANVIWCQEDWQDRTWRDLSVTATALSSTITVFARSNNLYAATNCLTFYDAFTLAASAPPPQITISNVVATKVDSRTERIEWDTNVASTSRVDYGLTTTYGKYVENTALVTHHSVNLAGLKSGKLYHYKVTSTASGYATAVSGDYTFNF